MHNHYIINGVIEFHPATSTLRDLNNPEHVVVLNSPAGRCLLLLIKRIGTIVTQQEFMEIVWEKSGMLVSPNTFYQNISILRKGLKKIGLLEDPVVTIPRIGLTLTSGTKIKKLTTEKEVEVSHENAHVIDESTLTYELSMLDQQEGRDETKHAMAFAAPEPEPESRPVAPAGLKEKWHNVFHRSTAVRHVFWAVGVLAAVALAAGLLTQINAKDDSQYFADYRFIDTRQGCHLLVADRNLSAEEKASVLSYGDQFKESCARYPWLYITHYSMLPRVSVIRCDKPMNEPNNCISEYFFRDR